MDEASSLDFTSEEYREFLDGLGIGGVRLESSRSECSVWRLPDGENSLEAEPSFEVLGHHPFEDESGFLVMAKTGVVFTLHDEFAAGVEAVFIAVYTTDNPPRGQMLQTFVDTNLALHVWPYAREFVQNTVSRFGWEAYSLPLFVPG